MNKITRLGWLAYGLAVLVVVLDQASKAYLIGPFHLIEKGSVRILPFFSLTSVENRGVSFGMLTAGDAVGRWLLVVFSAAVVVALVVWAARNTRVWTGVAVGLIIGGAVGNNLIDRVRFGAVTDFLDFTRLGFPWVFNVADSAITVGVILLLIDSLLTPNAAAKAVSR
jgi:signal peptidase II